MRRLLRTLRPTRRAEPDQLGARTERARRGAAGEDAALAHYRRRGFRLVARRLATRQAEIDLLVRKRRLFVALEVKARSHPRPEAAFDPGQLLRIAEALRQLAPKLRPRPVALRVDAVAVRLGATGEPVEILPFTGTVQSLGPSRSS